MVWTGFYPLGSCTMKYNPKMNENVARMNGFAHLHPLQEEDTVQGALELMYDLQEHLSRNYWDGCSDSSTCCRSTWGMDRT